MKTLKGWAVLTAFCGIAFFLTACGGDDDNGPKIYSPETLAGRSYSFSGGGPTSITFGGNTFVMNLAGVAETGTYAPQRNGNIWDVALTNPQQTWTRQIVFNFTSPTSGSYTFREPGAQTPATGTFVETTQQTQTPTPPPSNNNNNGNNNGNNGNTNTNNPATAPASIRTITIHTDANSVSGVSDYTVQLSGTSNGTFTANNGTAGDFTYSVVNSTTARLRLNYGGQFAPDYDDMTLNFSNGTISGTQLYSNNSPNPGPISGTFSGVQ